jgi:hypothetical protein
LSRNGTALGAVSVLLGAFFIGRWHHTIHEGHSPNLGLHVDLAPTGSASEARSYSATLTNYGILPVFVTTCDAVTDTSHANQPSRIPSSGVSRQGHRGEPYLKYRRPRVGASRFQRE